jgi:hypothetical protein
VLPLLYKSPDASGKSRRLIAACHIFIRAAIPLQDDLALLHAITAHAMFHPLSCNQLLRAEQVLSRLTTCITHHSSKQLYPPALLPDRRLNKHPDKEWLEAFYARCKASWPSFTAQGLSTLAWALASLELQPRQDWMVGYCAAVEQQLPASGPQALANMAWALARLGYRWGPACWSLWLGSSVPVRPALVQARAIGHAAGWLLHSILSSAAPAAMVSRLAAGVQHYRSSHMWPQALK